MSRTLHHGRKAKARTLGYPWRPGRDDDHVPPRRKRTRCAWQRWKASPRWWRKMTMTTPRRAAERRLARAVLLGLDPDAIPWPYAQARYTDYYCDYYW